MSNDRYKPKNKVRFVTATSLYDGHDVSINIMRRLLVDFGAEVVHLGHNRSVEEIVGAAIDEDVQGIAVSSYQGGHVLFFKYMVDMLKERGAGHIKIFGGGGGVIVPAEMKELEEYGITKIYSPEDGRLIGLDGIVGNMVANADFNTSGQIPDDIYDKLKKQNHGAIARLISYAESLTDDASLSKFRKRIKAMIPAKPAPIVGITGTGGAGKSSLTDEIVVRILAHTRDKSVAIISVDPSRRKTGGALLGDRIRMNSLGTDRTFMRSLATRGAKSELSLATHDAVDICRVAGFDVIFVETSGIGQGDAEITEICDLPIYVMTSEFGASMQLEKIDMLDFAEIIAINKFERKGSEDALRDVRKQYRRNRKISYDITDENLPVIGTIASRFNDMGVNSLYGLMVEKLREKTGHDLDPDAKFDTGWVKRADFTIIPREREKYLGEIAQAVRNYRKNTFDQVYIARRVFQLEGAIEAAKEAGNKDLVDLLATLKCSWEARLSGESKMLLDGWDCLIGAYSADELTFKVRDKEIKVGLNYETLAGTKLKKVAVPDYADYGERLKYLKLENVPGAFPFTAGVFPFKRADEDPKRQFAGEGGPSRTNRRFHLLSHNDKAKRLSTAFDSPTLYGQDPDERPDIFGKIGESGVSICTLDDMKILYGGFDLVDPFTSVSMTINGPAPMVLAMFFNTAYEQQLEKFKAENNREPNQTEASKIWETTIQNVRGTVQADILKEDQGQNTCIFSIDFALRMMGDIQQYFIDRGVRNYYSVSISGYHIAEAGAFPISQMAFTMSNGFSYVEYYLSRGMKLDDFVPNLSFFFSNGLDAEYSVIGRVARRIWAIVMRDKYNGNDRSQKLKYHIQTSGRSLHAQEMDFNDIRTTLQALIAYYDNCNSLHTNSYDEAVTTPTEESVRRAMAIQMIIAREFGLAKNENNAQGSYIMEELTDLVEEAVLCEFERISERGGALGAMETGYQRGKIQEESMIYEMRKHTGELPIIGVNTYVNPDLNPDQFVSAEKELARSTDEEKRDQYDRLVAFRGRNKDKSADALRRLCQVIMEGGNIFEEMLSTVRYCSLGEITNALYEVGGKYRRNM